MVNSTPTSPVQGKSSDTVWNWWDFYPLTDQHKRPVEWARSCAIFSAHATKPQVSATHFSSSKQFTIPSPAPITSSPAAYEPPTVISVSPSDEWLFAYFPGSHGDGAGCLWKRGTQIDNWKVHEWWSFARGAGVVTAAWAGSAREWAMDASGASYRLPSRGPSTPVSSPTLLLVTQAHELNICYIRSYTPSMKVLACSLRHPSSMLENQQKPINEAPDGPGGTRLCVHASIALGYNEPSILVATRSHLYPPNYVKPDAFNAAMEMDLPTDLGASFPQPGTPVEWETWGEESTIELCEVNLTFNGLTMRLSSNPLPSLQQPKSGLSKLSFICTPFSATPDPSTTPARPPDTDKGRIYLASSYLDFGDYTVNPTSQLVVHSITRNLTGSPLDGNWTTELEAVHIFASGVLAFFEPCGGPVPVGIYVGVLDTSGRYPSRARKSGPNQVAIGNISVLDLPNLNQSADWNSSLILTSTKRVGHEIPLNAAISPNHVLMCTLSSSLSVGRTSIHCLPKYKRSSLTGVTNGIPPMSYHLATAVLARRTTCDLTHALALPSVPIDDMVETLYHGITMLDTQHNGLPPLATWEAIGLVVDMYRMRARHTIDKAERESLTASWQAIRDMCSMASCNHAFADCNEEKSLYDLDAVWQLVGLCSWVVGFVERLMKECVLAFDVRKAEPLEESADDLFGSRPPSPAPEKRPLDAPILLHLIQPYALINLHSALGHVRRFRADLATRFAKTENAQLARDILLDIVDCSGMDLDALDGLLSDSVKDLLSIAADDARRSLSLCRPVAAMEAPLQRLIQKMTQSSVVDKSRLFIKPADFIDGSPGRIGVQPKDKDVVSKGPLPNHVDLMTCVRCGGQTRSALGAKPPSLRWYTSMRIWNATCICGGKWGTIGV